MSKQQLPVDAWMPLFVGDWMTGEATSVMDPYQKGVFIDLLAMAWKQRGSLPDNLTLLAKFGGCPVEYFSTTEGQHVLAQFPVGNDGRRRNPKQAAVYQDAVERRQDKHDKAQRAALARWGVKPDQDPPAPPQGGGQQETPPPPPPPAAAPSPALAALLEKWPTVVAFTASSPERLELLRDIANAGHKLHGANWVPYSFLPLVNFALQDGRKPEAVEAGLRDWFGMDEKLNPNRLRAFFAGATRSKRTVESIESSPSRGTTTRRSGPTENRPAGGSKFVDA